jgi:ATP-binding cassette subfamily B protein
LGIIFQDYAHYHFLVRDAIAVGRLGEESTLEKVQRAAEASEADVFIGEWEKNYDQMLGKEFTGGVEPSIGQWQKLALARTFYRQPRVLVLDEPTSSIDAEAEAKIFEKLEKLPSDRTVILISHRFSTVRRAGKIAVIEAGRLKEFGSHVELLELKGIYARLFAIQAKGYK